MKRTKRVVPFLLMSRSGRFKPPYQYQIGELVKYDVKNEIGLIKSIKKGGTLGSNPRLVCWWHTGDTAATIDSKMVSPLTMQEVVETKFSNEYAKASLMERQLRMFEFEDASDIIDDGDVRSFIHELLEGVDA